jgi:hypothetical protein
MSDLSYAILQFTQEAGYLAEKRKRAIELLGDKWILAKNIERKTK